MAVEHLNTIKGEFVHVGTVAGLFELSRQVEGGQFTAFVVSRQKAPSFIIRGDTQEEVIAEGFSTISQFLDRMHTFGFRNAA